MSFDHNSSIIPTQLPIFQQSALLRQALTHRSYANEHPGTTEHNERLEFLGDAVLNFLSGEFLYQTFPNLPEGELTTLRSALVDKTQLANFAIALNLGKHIYLSKGAEQEGGRDNPKLLSRTFEAMIGAYFLDASSNIDQVRSYIVPFFESVVKNLVVPANDTLGGIAASAINYKSRLQEWALANGKDIPDYAILAELGPDHSKTFIAEVRIDGKPCGRGEGRKKQEAEKAAAQDALHQLNLV